MVISLLLVQFIISCVYLKNESFCVFRWHVAHNQTVFFILYSLIYFRQSLIYHFCISHILHFFYFHCDAHRVFLSRVLLLSYIKLFCQIFQLFLYFLFLSNLCNVQFSFSAFPLALLLFYLVFYCSRFLLFYSDYLRLTCHFPSFYFRFSFPIPCSFSLLMSMSSSWCFYFRYQFFGG